MTALFDFTFFYVASHIHVLHIGGASVKSEVKSTKSSTNRQSFKVGRIGDDDTVVSEAVVEINITPISTLIHSPNVRWCVEKALEQYMDKTRGNII